MESGELDAKIGDLASKVKGSFVDQERRDGQFWRVVWSVIREIGNDFRVVRYRTKADKDAAWSTYSVIVEDVKQQQAQHLQQRDQKFRDRQEREEESRRVLAEIVSKAQAAWPHEDGFMEFLAVISGAKAIADLIVFTMEMVADILTLGLLRPGEVDPRKAQLLNCSTQMKEAWAVYKSTGRDLLPRERDRHGTPSWVFKENSIKSGTAGRRINSNLGRNVTSVSPKAAAQRSNSLPKRGN